MMQEYSGKLAAIGKYMYSFKNNHGRIDIHSRHYAVVCVSVEEYTAPAHMYMYVTGDIAGNSSTLHVRSTEIASVLFGCAKANSN